MDKGKELSKLKICMTSTESATTTEKAPNTRNTMENIVLAPTSRIVEDEVYGDDDSVYTMSFQLNDTFKESNSHAAEAEMLHTYAPTEEYGEEGTYPYVAIQLDNGLCIVYEKSYVGTENEQKLIKVLDEVAESYCEQRKG